MNTKLSKRQQQVLKMILAGYTIGEISRLLNIKRNTIYNYRRIIMEKWAVENHVELIVESIKRGYLEIDEMLEKEENEPIKMNIELLKKQRSKKSKITYNYSYREKKY